MELECPKCKKNEWFLEYNGTFFVENLSKFSSIETLSAGIGEYGDLTFKCSCGYTKKLSIGSD